MVLSKESREPAYAPVETENCRPTRKATPHTAAMAPRRVEPVISPYQVISDLFLQVHNRVCNSRPKMQSMPLLEAVNSHGYDLAIFMKT